MRPDSTVEKLAQLKPVFERPWGKVTPGNSSQITDGASWVILASEEAVAQARADAEGRDRRQRVVGARSLDHGSRSGAVGDRDDEAQQYGARAISRLWELNEAFAAQVLGCLAAWNDEKFCREILGLDGAAGRIDREQAQCRWRRDRLGHPVGASGNRIVLHLVNAMKRLGTQARHRHRMHRWRPWRRHADRDGVSVMQSQIMDVLGDRVLELGPHARRRTRPWRNFRLARDEDGVAWLLFDREDASANTLSGEVIDEFDACSMRSKAATGRGLCSARRSRPASSPAPTSTNSAAPPIRAQSKRDRAAPMRVIDRLEALHVPTIAVIHGFCLGGGLEIALACRYRIAIDDARFGFPEVMLGLHPGLGGTARFTRLVNPMQAMTLDADRPHHRRAARRSRSGLSMR